MSFAPLDNYQRDYPSFLQFLLRTEFDPSKSFSEFPSHKYDELDNALFSYYLYRTFNREVVKEQKKEVFEHITFRDDKKRWKDYWEKWKNVIYKALIIYMSKTSLTDKWTYVIKDVFLENATRYRDNVHEWTIKLALHKSECAYGKAVKIIIVYDEKKGILRGLRTFRLIGIIPEQYIAFNYNFQESSSYGGWTSYPSSSVI